MKSTRSSIGLLTAQYRSVLKKCALTNLGLYALGAAVAMSPGVAKAADLTPTPTLRDNSAYTLVRVEDNTLPNVIQLYSINQETKKLETAYYQLNLRTTEYGEGDSQHTYTISAPFDPVTITVNYNPETVHTSRWVNSEDLSDQTVSDDFLSIHTSGGYVEGSSIYNSGKIGILESNIIDSSHSGSYSNGTGIFNTGIINEIKGDFIAVHSAVGVDNSGIAIFNTGQIEEISGHFIGNYTSASRNNWGGWYGVIMVEE